MNPILQIIFKKRLLRLWIGLSLLGGLYAPLRAQMCPAGWTSLAKGILYPVSAAGMPNSSYINNFINGGADRVVVRAETVFYLSKKSLSCFMQPLETHRVFALCKRPNSHFIKLFENEQNN